MTKPSPDKLTAQEKAALVKAVTKAIGYQENGGKPDLTNLKAGKSGEMKSIFQFTPDTWKAEAKKYLGSENEPLTPDAETTVVSRQVGDWIDEGKTVSQMASMWNAGHGEPNAYTGKFSNGQSSVGINKEGVKFNVPAYANAVNNFAKQFYSKELATTHGTPAPAPAPQNQPVSPLALTPSSGGGLMQQAAWHVPWVSGSSPSPTSPTS